MFNVKFAGDDWIRTMDLWCLKQQLYQLSHNHCPVYFLPVDSLARLTLCLCPSNKFLTLLLCSGASLKRLLPVWPDGWTLSIFDHLQHWKFVQEHSKIAKVSGKLCQILNMNFQKYCQKLLKFSQSDKISSQIWSHWLLLRDYLYPTFLYLSVYRIHLFQLSYIFPDSKL